MFDLTGLGIELRPLALEVNALPFDNLSFHAIYLRSYLFRLFDVVGRCSHLFAHCVLNIRLLNLPDLF